MKYVSAILLSIFLLFLWGCPSRSILGPDGLTGYPGGQHLAEAEKRYQEGEYRAAHTAYKAYVAKYPQSPMAPAALLKIGSIHTIWKQFEEARAVYAELMSTYPDSPFALDAMVSILASYYQQGEFDEVLRQAPLILKKTDSRFHVIKAYTLLGDASMAIDEIKDAAFFYSKAHQLADGQTQEEVGEKLDSAIGRLKPNDIRSFIGHAAEKPSLIYLLFQIARYKDEDKQYSDALWVLSEFVKIFPEHEKVGDAEVLIEKYREMSVYNRYTIGCLLPLSGTYGEYGKRALNGIEYALSQFTATEVNPMLRIVIRDTGSEEHKAVGAVQALTQERVAAIIGPIITAESVAPIAQKEGIPLVAITQKEGIVEKGDYIFRNFFTPKMQIQTIVKYAVGDLGLNRFAILYPDDNYGEKFMNLFWDEVVKNNGSIVGVEAYAPDATDFSDTIKKISGSYYDVPKGLHGMRTPQRKRRWWKETRRIGGRGGPAPIVDFDAVFIPDEPKRTAMLIPQLAYHDINDVYLLGTNLWHSDKLLRMAYQYAQRAIMADVFFAESESPNVQQFVNGFEEIYGVKPGFMEAIAYDSAMIILQLISRQEITFRSALRDSLFNLHDYPGMTGITSFEPNGEVRKKLYLLGIKKDQFIELKPGSSGSN
jgi:ABC-type branched-subunit amino acid transport system substrate-binding protein